MATFSSVSFISEQSIITSHEYTEDLSFDDMLNIITSYPTTPYEKLKKNETALNVGRIITSMPDNLREILLLSYFKRFFYKQMVQILSIPIRAVKSKPHTAVGRFAKNLERISQD
jgi:DNA-directed RNA polymerase specialized sigma24 family protein